MGISLEGWTRDVLVWVKSRAGLVFHNSRESSRPGQGPPGATLLGGATLTVICQWLGVERVTRASESTDLPRSPDARYIAGVTKISRRCFFNSGNGFCLQMRESGRDLRLLVGEPGNSRVGERRLRENLKFDIRIYCFLLFSSQILKKHIENHKFERYITQYADAKEANFHPTLWANKQLWENIICT